MFACWRLKWWSRDRQTGSTGAQIPKQELDLGGRWDPRRLATVLLLVAPNRDCFKQLSLWFLLPLEVGRGFMSRLGGKAGDLSPEYVKLFSQCLSKCCLRPSSGG